MSDSVTADEKRRWLLETIRAFVGRVDPGYMRLNPSTEKFAKDLCYEFFFTGFVTGPENAALSEALIADSPLLESLYRTAMESAALTDEQLLRFLDLVSPLIAERWLAKLWRPGEVHGGPRTVSTHLWEEIWPEGFPSQSSAK